MQTEASTLIHFLKSCLGSGILAMPAAFKHAGVVTGTVGTLVISVITAHCAYVLVKSAEELCKKCGKSSLTYPEVAEEACRKGPPWCRAYGRFARRTVNVGICITYFGICSAFTVIVANHFDKVTAFYYKSINIRLYIVMLLPIMLLLSYVPNLKYLLPINVISNLFTALGLGVTTYYLVREMPPRPEYEMNANISTFPTFVSITVLALQGIGGVLPLRNSMKRPENFISCCGVLNQASLILAALHVTIGILGYSCYGDKTLDNITLNLPRGEYLSQAVQVLIGLSVCGAYGIQFFVYFQILWSSIEDRFKANAKMVNRILRAVMTLASVLLAVIVPNITAFISLIGALLFTTVGILVPIVIEIVTFWENGFGRYRWILIKDVIIIIAGLLAVIVGTKDSIEAIVKLYI